MAPPNGSSAPSATDAIPAPPDPAAGADGSPGSRLRPAVAADLELLARVIDLAWTPPFPHSWWATLCQPLGTDPVAFLMATLAEGAWRWGRVDQHLILEDAGSGQPLGACALYPAPAPEPDPRPVDLSRLDRIAARLGWTPGMAAQFQALMDQDWSPEETGHLSAHADAVLEGVAILPQAQGWGHGRQLIQAALRTAKAQGHGSVQLGVTWGNARALALYQDCGFRPLVTWHAAYFSDDYPGYIKLIARL